MGPLDDTAEKKLAFIARRSHGVVTRSEALRAGLSVKEIRRRVDSGALLREHRGVYRVGHRAPSTEASFIAAVKACGEGAVLSGRAAAHLLGLVRGSPPAPEVTSPGRRRVQRVKTRRGRVARADRTIWRGIPVTAVPRTLVDLAALLPQDELARAFHEAGIRHHTTPEQVEAALARRPNSPGAAALRRVVRGDVRVSLSRLESRFLALLREQRLPEPETNRPVGAHRVDARWPRYRLTVELDSYRYHRSRHAWEQDRRREREARARGDRHRRFTHDDVLTAPERIVAELRALLCKSSPRVEGWQSG
jgi:very-short-patch-repair endonuclease